MCGEGSRCRSRRHRKPRFPCTLFWLGFFSLGATRHLPASTGDGAGQTESGCEDGAGVAASRGLRDDYAALRAVGHGVDARGTGQIPGAAIGRQDSPAYGEGSVRSCGSELRIVGWIVGWKFRLCAAKCFGMMVARDGVEPPTPAFSGLRSTT